MTTYLCSVGIDNYDDVRSLQYAVADAREIHTILTDRHSGTASVDESPLLVGAQATSESVATALGSMARRATETDLVVFYFAGHALHHDGETYLLLHGEKAAKLEIEQLLRLSLSAVHRLLVTSNALLSLIIVDACHVGDSAAAIRQQQSELRNRGHGQNNCVVLYGSADESVVRESSEARHGIFTSRIIEYLRHGRAEPNGALRVRGLLGISADDVSILTATLSKDPVVAWLPIPEQNMALELVIQMSQEGDGELGAPAHPLEGSLVWIDRLVTAARSSASLGSLATQAERWQKLLEALCDSFELVGAAVFEQSSKGGGIHLMAEKFRDALFDQSSQIVRAVLSRMGRALNEKELWSRRRSGVREVLDIDGLTLVAVLIPIGNRPYARYVLLLSPAESMGNASSARVFETEGFAHSLRAVLAASESLTCQDHGQLLSAALDDLRRMTGFIPVELYSKRLGLFQAEVDGLHAVYQPIVSLLTPQNIKGFEALARNSNGATPLHLFGVAQLWGRRFKTYLDLHMATTAMDGFASYVGSGEQSWAYTLSINSFADSIFGDSFAADFKSAVAECGVPPDNLILEISERASLSASMQNAGADTEETVESLALYREALTEFTRHSYVRFALDDFGIERANIARLTGLNLSYVKVDRSVLYSSAAAATFRFVSEVMNSMGDYPMIIAEGWEEGCGMTIEALMSVGCHYIQGYGLGRPNLEISSALDEAREKSGRLVMSH